MILSADSFPGAILWLVSPHEKRLENVFEIGTQLVVLTLDAAVFPLHLLRFLGSGLGLRFWEGNSSFQFTDQINHIRVEVFNVAAESGGFLREVIRLSGVVGSGDFEFQSGGEFTDVVAEFDPRWGKVFVDLLDAVLKIFCHGFIMPPDGFCANTQSLCSTRCQTSLRRMTSGVHGGS